MAKVLDGQVLANRIEADLKYAVDEFVLQRGRKPMLATILVGNDHASATYVTMKQKAAIRIGMGFVKVELPETATLAQVLGHINALNLDRSIDGILLQHPVPKHINEQVCFDSIALEKDVDGCNSASFGKMTMSGHGFLSATPFSVVSILKHYNIEVAGKHAVVIGRSPILGKPVAMALLNMDATVTICHSKTVDLPKFTKQADIVVACVGKAKLVQADWLKKGVVLIDAGYNKGNVGDIDLQNAKEIASAYTPVPGGVGPVTIMKLLEQTLLAASKRT